MTFRVALIGIGFLLAGCVGPDIRGRVVDNQGEPLEDAVVQSGNRTVMTDADGFYVIENAGPGDYHRLSVTAPGYETKRQTVRQPEGFGSGVILQDFVLGTPSQMGERDPLPASSRRAIQMEGGTQPAGATKGQQRTQPAGAPRPNEQILEEGFEDERRTDERELEEWGDQ